MQRDKRGRFVKKAHDGTIITLDGKSYKVKSGATQAFTSNPGQYSTFNDWFASDAGAPFREEQVVTGGSTDDVTGGSTGGSTGTYQPNLNLTGSLNFGTSGFNTGFGTGSTFGNQSFAPKSVDYFMNQAAANAPVRYTTVHGSYVDENGIILNSSDIFFHPEKYKHDPTLMVTPNYLSLTSLNNAIANQSHYGGGTSGSGDGTGDGTGDEQEQSAGMNWLQDKFKGLGEGLSKAVSSIDKTKLANFLELTRAGIGIATNNKIAERALEAEKPFLQDVSESHRSVYGDYRSQVQGEKAAAQLRNMASKPLTSDGALQQQMMMEAQIKGQEYIDQGNAKDDAMRRQTQEVAWQQEKENQQQRQAVAMQNRQAMLMSEKNKTQIENMRDSANYSQVVEQYLGAQEKRLRSEGVEQDYYQDYYNDALVQNDVYANFRDGLTATQKAMIDTYQTSGTEGLTKYLNDNKLTESDWIQTQRILNNEVIRRKAALKGATINPASLNGAPSNTYGIFGSGTSLFKKGGTVYRARLTKRTRDNDRTARSLESSRKIAARFLEKAIDSLYTYDDVELIAKPKKSKKRKYQAGGGLPFVGFTPVFATSEKGAPAATTKAEKEDKDDLTTKDILTLLKDMDGLPSDMQIIVSSLQNFALQDKMDPLGLSSSSDIASRYISLMNKIKVAKFNREEYNNAFNQLKSNGGLTELAITSEGMLIGTNAEGDFEYFTPEEASKGEPGKEGYQLLTNSNLLYLRANSLDAAFNQKLTSVAQTGIGIEAVNKLITDAISNLGSSSSSEEGYAKTKQGELIQGLEDFLKAAQASGGAFDGTVNDLYKGKYLTKSQAEQAKKAMQYIYSTLPSNAKALLKVKSDGSESGALKLIETLVTSKESTQTQFDVDLVGGKSHKSTTSTSGKDGTDLETSLPLNVLKNVGGVDTYLDIDRGDGIHMSVRGTQFNLIKTPNGEPISDTSLSNMLQQSGLQSIVKDMRNIQFGDQKISPEALSFITYNNTGVTRANLPIKADGSVNLALLEAYEKAERELDLSEDKSPDKRREVYEQYGITSLLNADGTYNQSKFAPFIVTEGYTTDALSGIKESDFVVEYRGNTDAAVSLMQKSLAVGTGKNVVTPEIDEFSWFNPADWFGWTDTVFKGVVYIPITNNVNTAVFGANQSLDYDEAMSQEEKYQNFEKMSHQRSTDASVLNI